MAFRCVGKEWCPYSEAYRQSFVLDSPDDVAKLPKCCVGSVAVVATKGGSAYMVNASGEWVEQ